ncbi:hypothetical protein L7F22_059105 [Adiantum nelumboides]|nr:hypothetical protein [Adiantum nelumboides]
MGLVASCLTSCCASCACEACRSVAGGISRRSARIAYCGLFALSLVIALMFREFAAPMLEKIPWINTFAHVPEKEWFETQAVVRVSLGNFLFFLLFAVLMVGVKDQKDVRDSWHHGGWLIKFIMWSVLIALMFFLPNGAIYAYESMSKFGSGIFLLIQVILLLDFTHSWNAAWVQKDEKFWYIALLIASLFCYMATFTLVGLLFHWFTVSGQDCQLNVFFIVMTMFLAVVFTVISLHPKVGGSLLPASVVSLYCAYLGYSGLSSEPRDYECNGLHNHVKAVSSGTLVLGLLTTVLSVVYSAVRAGSSTALLSPPASPQTDTQKPLLPIQGGEEEENDQKDEQKPVTYVYSFFHLIFALASMYSAMLLTGWTNARSDGSELIDVGWPSVWVRMTTQWVTAGLFLWSLIAPLMFPDREFY